MRKLVIPDISFAAQDGEGTIQMVSAAQQLQQLASVPSNQGQPLTIEDIRQRLPLVEKLAEVAGNGSHEVLLEEEEYATLLQAVQASTWTGVSRGALELVDAVEKAETVEVKETETEPGLDED
jgi:hypothetical protein